MQSDLTFRTKVRGGGWKPEVSIVVCTDLSASSNSASLMLDWCSQTTFEMGAGVVLGLVWGLRMLEGCLGTSTQSLSHRLLRQGMGMAQATCWHDSNCKSKTPRSHSSKPQLGFRLKGLFYEQMCNQP